MEGTVPEIAAEAAGVEFSLVKGELQTLVDSR